MQHGDGREAEYNAFIQRIAAQVKAWNTATGYPHKKGIPKRDAIAEAQSHRCAYCGIKCDGDNHAHNGPSIDEVIPRVAGGRRVWENQVLACRLCNNGRGSIDADVYFAKVKEVGRRKAYRWGRSQQHVSVKVAIVRASSRRAGGPEHVRLNFSTLQREMNWGKE